MRAKKVPGQRQNADFPSWFCVEPHASSSIQTILSVPELHRILRNALADFTADREFHPALKTVI